MRRASLLPTILRLCRAGLVAVLAPAAAAADEPDYTLGTGDRLRIAVYERADLSGEFTVGPSASLSLPLLGRIRVEGLTLAQFEGARQRVH